MNISAESKLKLLPNFNLSHSLLVSKGKDVVLVESYKEVDGRRRLADPGTWLCFGGNAQRQGRGTGTMVVDVTSGSIEIFNSPSPSSHNTFSFKILNFFQSLLFLWITLIN